MKINHIAACVSSSALTQFEDDYAKYLHLSGSVNYPPASIFTLDRTFIYSTEGQTMPINLALMCYYDKVNSSADSAGMFVRMSATELYVLKLTDTYIPSNGIQD